MPLPDVCRKAGVRQVTYFNLLRAAEMRRAQVSSKDENAKLKRIVPTFSLLAGRFR